MHKFTIADDDAVQVLMEKLLNGGKHQLRRERLLRALDDAMRHYNDPNQKVLLLGEDEDKQLCS